MPLRNNTAKRLLTGLNPSLYIYFLLLIPVGLFSGCSDNVIDSTEWEDNGQENISVRFNINTVALYASKSDVDEKEIIRTLRFIIVDQSSNKIERNSYFSGLSEMDFYSGQSEISDKFMFSGLTPGKKHIFIFANEKSVRGITTTIYGINISFDYLTEFFNNSTIGNPDFKDIVNSVYFSPSQEYINQDGLPYSSYYECEIEKGVKEITCFLVPVSTKFRVKIFNYRGETVTLNDLQLSSIADNNYLMAHVGDSDYQKSLPGSTDKLYWIDWLRKVSELSWNYDEPAWNDQFNTTYGWISNFDLPDDSTNTFPIPSVRLNPVNNQNNPLPVVLGPYYLQESKAGDFELNLSINYPNPNYSWWGDKREELTQTCKATIENMESFFRNSFLDIDIELSKQGDITIGYTVCPWTDYSTDIGFY